MSIIVSLKDKEHIKENLDDFALFILNKNSIDIQDSIKYNTEDLNELEDLYKEFIRSKIKPNPKEIELAFKIYDKFFIMLYNHFYPSIQEQPEKQTQFYKELEKGSRCMHYDFNIFTTNYDTLIEKYFIDNLKDEVYTGSEGPKKYFNMGDFNSRYSQSNSTQVKLIKLHGSKNWLKDNEGNLIEKGLDEDIISVSSGRISGAITGEL
jgi:NAD-dependent SIR2 family protein deacetylase